MQEERLTKLTILLLFTKNATLAVSNTRVYGCGPNVTLYIRNLHIHIFLHGFQKLQLRPS